MSFFSWDWLSEPVTHVELPRQPGMEYDDDPIARVQQQRRRALIEALIPRVRRLNPTMPDDQVIELAESMAEMRLLDGEVG